MSAILSQLKRSPIRELHEEFSKRWTIDFLEHQKTRGLRTTYDVSTVVTTIFLAIDDPRARFSWFGYTDEASFPDDGFFVDQPFEVDPPGTV